MIDLRGKRRTTRFRAAVKEVTGADLPTAPRTSVAWGEIKLFGCRSING